MSDLAHTALGTLRGDPSDGVIRFRAVPYAEPPTGTRRFAKPAPPQPWTGIKDVSRHGPIAPQPPSRLRAAMGDFGDRKQDENCLTLAIATPAADTKRRPVIVWLHGGAFLSGAGSLDWYDGGPMAKFGDTVVVGVNYRLGPLGFLHYPGLADGMNGLHDIAAALGFIQAHIAAFGGDKDNVTLMGQSAGGGAIWRLIIMPQTKGLFHRVIVQSGTLHRGLKATEATERAIRLMHLLDIDPNAPNAVENLRAAPLAPMITLQMQIARENARFAAVEPAFPPVFDDFTGVDDFATRITQAAAERGIPILAGTTREEIHAFFVADPAMATPDPAATADRFAASNTTIEAYRHRRPGGDTRDLLADLVTDDRFLFPQLHLAEKLAGAGVPTYLYEFNWAAANGPWRACHCIELPFVFGTSPAWDAPMIAGVAEAEYTGLSTAMMQAWTSFARTGKPEIPDTPWPTYETQRRMTMGFGPVIGAVGDPAGAAWRLRLG